MAINPAIAPNPQTTDWRDMFVKRRTDVTDPNVAVNNSAAQRTTMNNAGLQSDYLSTLMSGVKAAQNEQIAARVRDAQIKKQRAMIISAAQTALTNRTTRLAAEKQQAAQRSQLQGGYMNAATSINDWGDPINDPNFAQNYLTTIKLPNGQRIMVHKNAAQQMAGFLNDLWNQGYKFSDVQTYNKRKVAGSNLWSRHSTGLAMDIDPGKNPFSKNAAYTLPKNAGQLAAAWGLSWLGPKNGDWMHFGVTAPQWKGMSPN